MSLAPISTMTASVLSGTDQSSRASAPEAVSPETPALMTSAAMPFFASAACSRGTKPSLCGSPRPAVNESPSATILTGGSAKACVKTGGTRMPAQITRQQTAACRSGRAVIVTPYDPGPLRGPSDGRSSTANMHDTLRQPFDGAAIALDGVNLSLGSGAARVHILRDISLNIGRGEAVALLGPSGSGKSTLLMVMSGLERPDSGAVQVAGEDLSKLSEDALARFRGRQIGIVFQAFHLIPTMTALENVAVPLELAGDAKAFARAERELIAVGLGERLTHYPAQLSGGEQQ